MPDSAHASHAAPTRVSKVGPSAVDRTIGRNIRFQRVRQGKSLEVIAQALGVTYQQVQKYEAGVNRLSGLRLERIAKALGVSIMTLLDGVDAPAAEGVPTVAGTLSDPETVRLIQAFNRIADAELKRHLLALVEKLANPAA